MGREEESWYLHYIETWMIPIDSSRQRNSYGKDKRHSQLDILHKINNRSSVSGNILQLTGADPGFLPGEGAKGMMTLSNGMGMSDF